MRLRFPLAIVALLALPAAHPLLRPAVGVASHLLWWVHVLPVSLIVYRYGRRAALTAVVASPLVVLLGERAFGGGYGVAADWTTAWALATALLLTHALMAGFALYARSLAARDRGLFDAANSGVLRLDARGRIRAANPAALRLLRSDWSRLRGKALREVESLAGLPEPAVLAARGWSGGLCVGPAERAHEVFLAATAVHDDDSPGYQVVLVDRTTEVAQEREIERQVRLSTLGEALAGVAHELKNPLQVILAYAEMVQEDRGLPERRRKDLGTIVEQGLRMRDMLQELLGYSRERVDRGAFCIDDLVHRLVVMHRMTRGARIQFVEEVRWTGEVRGSAARVEQILANLLSNAADAVFQQPDQRSGEVRVLVRERAGRVEVRISDDGPGVSATIRDRLFDPFTTTKPVGSGTGLGLAVSRRLAASMDGRLYLDEAVGPGATFVLDLPADARNPGSDVEGAAA
jgi:signal transduction histidine kinase